MVLIFVKPCFDDPSEGNYQSKMNYSNSFAFKRFILERREQYEFSDIDMTLSAEFL
jgi:uncharacterized protein YkuJ